jgi:hypothetical protein
VKGTLLKNGHLVHRDREKDVCDGPDNLNLAAASAGSLGTSEAASMIRTLTISLYIYVYKVERTAQINPSLRVMWQSPSAKRREGFICAVRSTLYTYIYREIVSVRSISLVLTSSISLVLRRTTSRHTFSDSPLGLVNRPLSAVEVAETCARIHPDPPPVMRIRVTWSSFSGETSQQFYDSSAYESLDRFQTDLHES